MLFRLIELIVVPGLFHFLGPLIVVLVVVVVGGEPFGDVIPLDNVPLADVSSAVLECTNICVHSVNGTSVGLRGCLQLCRSELSHSPASAAIPAGHFHFTAEMICSTDTQLTLQIAASHVDPHQHRVSDFGIPGLFVLELNAPGHVATFLATSATVRIANLHADTQYLCSGFVVSRSGRLEMIAEEKLATLPWNFQPQSVTNVSLPVFTGITDGGGGNLSLALHWQVPEQRSCFYDIHWHAEQEETHPETKKVEINSPRDSRVELLTLDHLRFGTTYQLAIQGVSQHAEGPVVWMAVKTPSCLEWSGNDLEQCPPATPERLSIDDVTFSSRSDRYEIKVTWRSPKINPDNYTIYLVDMGVGENQEGHRLPWKNVTSGNATSFTFSSVQLLGTHFEVGLIANSAGGSSAETFAEHLLDGESTAVTANKRLNKDMERLILVLLPAALLLGLVIFVYHVLMRRRKLFHDEDACLYRRDLPMTAEGQLTLLRLPIEDKMEVRREDIELLEDLGEGEFGLVKLGRLRSRDHHQLKVTGGGERIVAIKMLKHSPSTEEIVEFRREIDVMKSVGGHQHVVSIVGHYTRNIHELMLLTEYCPRGNLLNLLRRVWKAINSLAEEEGREEEGISSELDEPDLGNAVENKGYEFTLVNPAAAPWPGEAQRQKWEVEEEEEILVPTQLELLRMALQIALGMEYLAKNRVVHRDLAARNVLVCGDRTVKIADFGLSRDIYQCSVYKKTSNGKLPIKWMAIESLSHQIYTSQSDVWSFGIVLYELMTFGSTPYPAVANDRVLELLNSGYRMEKPVNCEDFVYDLMVACWSLCPNNRPHFSSIVEQVGQILEVMQGQEAGGGGQRGESVGGVENLFEGGFRDQMFI